MLLGNLAINFIKDKNVASIFPTTKKTVKKISSSIDFKRDITIIEYGSGNGVFSEYILSKLNNNSKLILIEKNKDLYFFLKNKFKEKNIKIFNDDARNIKEILKKENIEKVDYIISGIPFSFLEKNEKKVLIKDTYDVLKDNGKFLVYQFSKKIRKELSNNFKNIIYYNQFFNIPPLFVFECNKK